MSVVDRARAINYFTQASIINATSTLERVQLALFDIPVELAVKLGLAPEKGEMLKSTHRRVLTNVNGGMRKACEQLGGVMVDQVGEVEKLVNDLAAMRWQEKAAKKAAADQAAAPATLEKPTEPAKAAEPKKPPASKSETSKKSTKKKGAT